MKAVSKRNKRNTIPIKRGIKQGSNVNVFGLGKRKVEGVVGRLGKRETALRAMDEMWEKGWKTDGGAEELFGYVAAFHPEIDIRARALTLLEFTEFGAIEIGRVVSSTPHFEVVERGFMFIEDTLRRDTCTIDFLAALVAGCDPSRKRRNSMLGFMRGRVSNGDGFIHVVNSGYGPLLRGEREQIMWIETVEHVKALKERLEVFDAGLVGKREGTFKGEELIAILKPGA